jgi:hypothetical protein
MKLYNGEHLSDAKQFLLFIPFTLIIIYVVCKTLYYAVAIRTFPDLMDVRHANNLDEILSGEDGNDNCCLEFDV